MSDSVYITDEKVKVCAKNGEDGRRFVIKERLLELDEAGEIKGLKISTWGYRAEETLLYQVLTRPVIILIFQPIDQPIDGERDDAYVSKCNESWNALIKLAHINHQRSSSCIPRILCCYKGLTTFEHGKEHPQWLIVFEDPFAEIQDTSKVETNDGKSETAQEKATKLEAMLYQALITLKDNLDIKFKSLDVQRDKIVMWPKLYGDKEPINKLELLAGEVTKCLPADTSIIKHYPLLGSVDEVISWAKERGASDINITAKWLRQKEPKKDPWWSSPWVYGMASAVTGAIMCLPLQYGFKWSQSIINRSSDAKILIETLGLEKGTKNARDYYIAFKDTKNKGQYYNNLDSSINVSAQADAIMDTKAFDYKYQISNLIDINTLNKVKEICGLGGEEIEKINNIHALKLVDCLNSKLNQDHTKVYRIANVQEIGRPGYSFDWILVEVPFTWMNATGGVETVSTNGIGPDRANKANGFYVVLTEK